MREQSALEVFRTFLKLGLVSFGGPIAHLGYFREEIVVRRRWVDDATYTDLVALCQFLPGPASSQVAFSLGLIRARYWGALAAWAGYTLPSAILMTAFAYGAGELRSPIGLGVLHGLKLVAVAIVAQAVWGMAAALCPDRQRASIAGIAAVILLFSNSSMAQIGVILLGGAAGFWLCRTSTPTLERPLGIPVSRRVGMLALGLFFDLLVALPILGTRFQGIALFDAFYRSGALVFGGGHVVSFWDTFRQRFGAQALMREVNAAVVGLLGASLYSLLWVGSVRSTRDFALALTGFVLLTTWRAPPLLVVILGAVGGVVLA